ncbi:MAG: ketopantoate reductase C-terminal domain-containing protein [Saprospiraceae bacterium]
MQIGILGVGSIGSVIARYLAERKAVELSGFNRSNRVKTIVYFQNQRFDISIPIHTTPQVAVRLDWIFICLKEHQFVDAKPFLAKLIQANTKVVVIRNGLRLSKPLVPFQSDNILAAQIDCPVERLADGNFKQLRTPILYVPEVKLANELEQLLPQIEIRKEVDFKTASWKKLIESSAIGAITALSGETCHVFGNERLLKLYRRLVEESLIVAQADGAQLPTDFTEVLIEKLKNYPPEKGSSMLTDRLAGKPIELGAKSGVIVQVGEEYGLETPLHRLVVDLLCMTNKRN